MEGRRLFGLFLLVAYRRSITARQFSVCLWSFFIIMIINLPSAGLANIYVLFETELRAQKKRAAFNGVPGERRYQGAFVIKKQRQ